MAIARKKILMIEPVSDLGGVSQYVLTILRFIRTEKFEIHVAASGSGPLFEVLKKNNIKVHDIKADYNVFSFLASVFSIRKLLKEENFSIVHAHTTKAGLLCAVAKIGSNIKMVYTGHCLRFQQKKNVLSKVIFYFFEQFICRSSSFITLLGRSDYSIGLSKGLFDHSKANIIPMSIDIEKFLNIDHEVRIKFREKFGIPKDAFVIGMVGRLSVPRDPETFVKVAEVVNNRIENAYFLWVGDGELREKTMKDSIHRGLSDKLVITGWQDSEDIPKLLSAIDIVLNATTVESMGIAILEAMASRIPIVANNVGAIPEIIKDGFTGWLFNIGDYEKAALIVERIYRKEYDLNTVKENAFKLIVDNYSPKEKLSNEFGAIYGKNFQ